MTADIIHLWAIVLGMTSLCAGVYLLAGLGASLSVFGGLLLSSVVYARTRNVYAPRDD